MSKQFSIVVLISGSGSNLQAIMDQINAGNINATIRAVISNRADAYGLERAEKAGIPNLILEHTQFLDRESFDHSLAQIIQSYTPDLIILAGFMRILSNDFVKQFQNILINIHPSLLPNYKGLHTHKRALQDHKLGKTKKHGATVHFVIPELDSGLSIIQGEVPILESDTKESLAQRVHKIEHLIYPKAVAMLADGSLRIESGKLLHNDKALSKPITITHDQSAS